MNNVVIYLILLLISHEEEQCVLCKQDLITSDYTGCPDIFKQRCACGPVVSDNSTKYIVNCTDTMFQSTEPLQALPDNTDVLIFVGNRLRILPSNTFGANGSLSRLEKIDLSNNQIVQISETAFIHTPNVRVLILSHNDIRLADANHSSTIFQGFNRLISLHLTNAFTETIDSQWYMENLAAIFNTSSLQYIEQLHLEQNEIWHLRQSTTFCSLHQLRYLYLGMNRLSSLEFDFDCLPQLAYIDLQKNSLHRLEFDTTERLEQEMTNKVTPLALNLYGNPFDCDCRLRSFIRWFKTVSTYLTRSAEYRCFNGYPLENKDRFLSDVETLQCRTATAYTTDHHTFHNTDHHTNHHSVPSTHLMITMIAVLSVLCSALITLLLRKRKHMCQHELRPQIGAVVRFVRLNSKYTTVQTGDDAVEVHV